MTSHMIGVDRGRLLDLRWRLADAANRASAGLQIVQPTMRAKCLSDLIGTVDDTIDALTAIANVEQTDLLLALSAVRDRAVRSGDAQMVELVEQVVGAFTPTRGVAA